ncbi:MAG: hypothetical protein IPK24_09950 [Kineosporiaceae bacterium]|nr:hypothetical protein [Kineosporiaceae bacterium]
MSRTVLRSGSGPASVLGPALLLALVACSGPDATLTPSPPAPSPSIAATAPAPSAPNSTSPAPSGSASGSAVGTATPSRSGVATPSRTRPPSAPAGAVGLGAGASLAGRRLFPADNPWNTPVADAPVDPASATLIAAIGATGHLHPDFGANWNGGPFGIPYVVVSGTQKKVPVRFEYADESDPGPYPIPPNAPIEGGAAADGDRHVIVVDRDAWRLYELFDAHPVAGGTSWTAGSGAVFDLRSNASRPAGWTSADAAGLPILPGLVRYDEVASGQIRHALRFTVSATRAGYVAPARHAASSRTDTSLPPMGMRVRLKASFDISSYPKQARVVLQALKTYGMIVADNGSSWYVSGAPDRRWDDDQLGALKQVPGNAFEVVRMGSVSR